VNIRPRTWQEAVDSEGQIRAGGTDFQERYRKGLAHGPIIDISGLKAEQDITWNAAGAARIGALTTLHTIAYDERLRTAYPGLTYAAGDLATPQIRRIATLGGSLLQHTRCWYYRHPAFTCYKNGGERCYARDGHHQNGVCFDLGPCVHPHPSTTAMALLAYEADVEINGRPQQPITTLYGDGADPTRDHRLSAGEILTAVHLPPPQIGERAAYFRAISRAAAEWPLVEALARLVIRDERIEQAWVTVGGVANIPLRLTQVEAALTSQPATPAVLAAAAEQAAAGVSPLPQTGYKVKLLVGSVMEVLERATNYNTDESR
jgi:xanthine dehydrogenase YagS FAD-binding subunit